MLKNRDVLNPRASTLVAARVASNPKAHETLEVFMVCAIRRIQGAVRVQVLSVSHISSTWSRGYEYPKSTGLDAAQEGDPCGRLTKTAGDYSSIRYHNTPYLCQVLCF